MSLLFSDFSLMLESQTQASPKGKPITGNQRKFGGTRRLPRNFHDLCCAVSSCVWQDICVSKMMYRLCSSIVCLHAICPNAIFIGSTFYGMIFCKKCAVTMDLDALTFFWGGGRQ